MVFKNIFLFLCLAVLFFGCDPAEALNPTNRLYWKVVNNVGEDVLIKSMNEHKEQVVKSRDTICFYTIGESKNNTSKISFSYLYNSIVLDDSLSLCNSQMNMTLKTWRESERDSSGRQFFNEKYWTKREYEEGKYMYHEWTFELLPEDIEQPENTAGL